jgi:putative selenate reductase
MQDRFHTIPIHQLLQIILFELDEHNSLFGIPEELFFKSGIFDFKTRLFNQQIETPIGAAAGPHTQLAQNIIAAWLMGARYIELKTIQTLDELNIDKPCIDMQDEGYNCEWSQELKVRESFHEYLNAWIIIHILAHRAGIKTGPGIIFNMSAGYNMEGILKENVQWFFAKMADCSAELEDAIASIEDIYPQVSDVEIPHCISDNITLSTMHGCPPEEIYEIASYLLAEKKLHTFVKLNPTLLGPEKLREILNSKLNFKTIVPDIAFEHDLKYDDALAIISNLKKIADENDLQFGLKLTNTLESKNNRPVFPTGVDMMYMSGRALHPISINLAHRLRKDLGHDIPFSFSAGADAFNIADTLSCGFITVTVCSDLLKPGGYMRLKQYFDELHAAMKAIGSKNIDEFILKKAGTKDIRVAIDRNLHNYSNQVLSSESYQRNFIKTPDIKTGKTLGYFDCISAPCQDTCSTHQDIPAYLYHASKGDFSKAFGIIINTNPFPSVTGMVCDHLCQSKCTRINYDQPLLIREVKRFISEQREVSCAPAPKNGIKVAIIGAGPSGLSCAYYLALAGFDVDVYEAESQAGGMVHYAIPGFRLTDAAIQKDISRIVKAGVNIHYSHKVDASVFANIRDKANFVFIGTGAWRSAKLSLPGVDSAGVIDPLEFLFRAKSGEKTQIGDHVVIIGGGNTAMDAARTAYRCVGKNGKVTVVYRRTIIEMPADQGEIKAVMEEGMEIIELASPEQVISENGKVRALLCSRMKLGEPDSSGRPKPEKIPGSEFEIHCDTIIPAIGQKNDFEFLPDENPIAAPLTYLTKMENVFIGGDALRNASTAINAIGDGRKAAEQIMEKAGIKSGSPYFSSDKNHDKIELIIKRSKRIYGAHPIETPADDRKNFKLVSSTLDKQTTFEEASRCLHCDEICDICTTVCPNFANRSYTIKPVKLLLQKIVTDENGIDEVADDNWFEIKQEHQILNIANFCNHCGNCNTFCPTNSAPYKEKPWIHLTKESFDNSEKGYFHDSNSDTIHYRENGNFMKLTDHKDHYKFESDELIAELNYEDLKIIRFSVKTPENNTKGIKKAAEMSIILKGIKTLF